MREKLKEHYDNLYSSEKIVFGSGRPSQLIEQLLDYTQSGTVLDIGGGEGRNAIFLAEKGFDVTVIDISSEGIKKLNNLAKEKNLDIETSIRDVIEDRIKKNYDIMVSSFMLHHLDKAEALGLIGNMMQHTSPGGFNVIATFTKDGDFFRKKPDTKQFYPDLGQIKEIYKDWEIVTYAEINSRAHATNKDGSPMFNISSQLIAKKI
jgi:tellurite methyltransferase|tara:strand:+ start:73 stop:690 length:618 start_codon:yes stop_codon:yes gene_type:complete